MNNTLRRAGTLAAGLVVTAAAVTACDGGSDGTSTPSATDTVTTTATDTASSAAPPTGSGVPTSGGGGATGSAGSSPGGDGTTLCTPTVLTFAVGNGEGAAGTSYFSITATNASKSPCVTTGFPGLALLDASGKQILQATREAAGVPVTTIVLAPGEKATAVVGAANMGNNSTQCPSSPALLFTMPDNTDSTKLVHTTPACSVMVRPFVKGTG